jgi:CheY-like chemotaxis protein
MTCLTPLLRLRKSKERRPAVARIVIVDDDKTFRGLIVTVLELEGHEALAIAQPGAIVATVRQEDPDLVLMDIHIGQRDTLGALRDLKSDEALNDIPVVMTSGSDRGQECLDAGADKFLMKPFRPSEMVATIDKLIR